MSWLSEELSGWPIGSGCYSASVGIDEARDMARAIEAALLEGDVIERVARELCAAAGENPDSNELWDEEPPWMDYTDEARAALAAALGEDER